MDLSGVGGVAGLVLRFARRPLWGVSAISIGVIELSAQQVDLPRSGPEGSPLQGRGLIRVF